MASEAASNCASISAASPTVYTPKKRSKRFKDNSVKLWCIGRTIYEDNEGRRRETGFCRSYDVVGERWIKENAY